MKATQTKLEKIASTDSLTGLYNRFEMDKRLQYEVHAMKRYGECTFEGFSILYIDIDNFKYINDTFGHQAGDLVLISFAEILKSTTRTVDIVARYGGDEFIVLMPNTDYEGAKIMADRIAIKLEEADSFKQYIKELKKYPISIDQKYRLAGSYGIAVYMAGESIDDMIKRADKALYAMKGLRR
jgi:polar amino acid transport system substrate-binding protein